MHSVYALDEIEADRLLAELDAQSQNNPSVYTYPATVLSESEADAQTVARLVVELDAMLYVVSSEEANS